MTTNDKDLIKFMEKYYQTIFKGMLNSTLKSDSRNSSLFNSESGDRRKEIEDEIALRSEKMATYLVRRLDEENLLDVESPSEQRIRELMEETIQFFGGQHV